MSPSSLAPLGFALDPVAPTDASIRQQTIHVLRQAILTFQLKPGQRLVERELIERLGVSRTTLREALRDLAAEGLVTVVPQKGARVCAPSYEEAVDLYDVRASLESIVVTRFIERASDEELEELRATVVRYEEIANRTTDILTLLGTKEAFYEVLIRGARSNALQQLLDGLKARIQTLRATSLSRPGRALETGAELMALVDAIAERNSALASRLCAQHVHNAGAIALADLRAREEASQG